MDDRETGVPRRQANRSHPGLSRERILIEALTLIDSDGAAALSMRSLASRLGIEAMSIYHHVRGREAVLDGVAEVLVSSIPPLSESDDWDTTVRAFAVGIHTVAQHHPQAFELVGMRPLTSAAAGHLVEPLLTCLRRAGLTYQDCIVVYRLVAAYARGFSLAEIAGLTLGAAQHDQNQTPDGLAPFAAALSTGHAETFERGLDVVVAGIRARVHPATPRKPGTAGISGRAAS